MVASNYSVQAFRKCGVPVLFDERLVSIFLCTTKGRALTQLQYNNPLINKNHAKENE
jgi:hypothetical protein